ncbi:MAG: histidine phosphatase family protein [Coriobacteriales bacterium]|jgi:broad specificity phosphatase PhoE|nr:histidine phosphatase family protein [Coriobacteriales bacterium]
MPKDPHGLFSPNRPTKILVMRHPETLQNLERRYQGQINTALSETGETQCQRAISGLIAWQPDVLIASPLDRCMAVACPVAEALELNLETDVRLMEMAFGELEGLDHNEAIAKGFGFPWDPSAGVWPVAGAETLEQFASRVISAADEISSRQGRIAVVTHGGVIRALTAYWMQISAPQFWAMAVRNVESSCYSLDEQGTIYLESFGLKPEWLGELV